MKRILKITLRVFIFLFSLVIITVVSAVILIRQPYYQTKVVAYVAEKLSNELKTEVTISAVDIKFFKTIILKNILIKDLQKDTLLYAGELKTSIDLFDLWNSNIGLNTLSLTDATVRMLRRKDEPHFNYAFIIDAFSSTDTSSSNSTFILDLKSIVFDKIHFQYLDAKNSLDLNIFLPVFDASLNKLDISKPFIDAKNALMENLVVHINMLPDSLSSKIIKLKNEEIDTAFVHLNTKMFGAIAGRFEMRNAKFIYDVQSAPQDSSGMFYYKHMNFDSINIIAENTYFIGDSIKGKLNQFSFKEKSGLEVDTMKGNFLVTPFKSSITNLVLKTPRSRITDRFQFSYFNFPAFYDFNNKVFIDADVKKNSFIDLRDIAAFSFYLNDFELPINISGKLHGTIANMKGKNMLLTTGNVTSLKGNISLVGLPNFDETFIDFITPDTRTDYADLIKLNHAIVLPINIKQFGTMSFNGSFTGFIKDFVAYGALQSNLGLLQSDLNMKNATTMATASYSGNISSPGINLGKLLEQDSLLGKMAFNARVSGKGLTESTVDAGIISVVQRFDFNNYSYTNIDINGVIKQKLFTGKLNVDDPNIKLDFQGTVDFNNDLPHYKFFATLDSTNLKALHFSNNDYQFATALQLNIYGDELNNITGDAGAINISFKSPDNNYLMKTAHLNISQFANEKEVALTSDLMDVSLKGEMDLITLSDALVGTIAEYFPSLPVKLKKTFNNQRFSYDIKTKDTKKFLAFFFPAVKGLSYASMIGNFNSNTHDISLTGSIPRVLFSTYDFKNTSIDGSTSKQKLSFKIETDTLTLNDSTQVLKPILTSNIQNDSAVFNFNGSDIKDSTYVDFTGTVKGGNDSIRVTFSSSNLTVQGKQWQIANDNIFVYGEKYLRISNLKFQSQNQSVIVYTEYNADQKTVIKILFNQLHLGDFYRYFQLGGYDAAGIIDGNADIINPLEALRLEGNFTITDFVFNGDTIHKITAKANYDINKDDIFLVLKAKDYKYDFEATGNISPAKVDEQLDIKVEVLKFKLPVLEKYLSEYISSLDGYTGGTLHLSGKILKPDLTGTMNIPFCDVKINYLQTAYSFNNEVVTFSKDFIDLGEMTLNDKFNNKAILGGEIFHNHLSDFKLNLFVNTDKFCILNTASKDNSLYYGKAIAGGIVTFKGPISNLEIDANLQSKQGTEIAIPVTDEYSVSQNKTIRFIGSGTRSIHNNFVQNADYLLSLNLDLELTNEAAIKIIFDQKAGDIINGRGNGNLRLEIKTNGEFNMYGDYTINRGDYLFTLKNFINKKFVIAPGGTISWSGDPYEAQINIDAIYSIQRAALKDLGNISASDPEVNTKVPVDVYMKLNGSLLQPNIAFDIRIPLGNNSVGSLANRSIILIKQDENELNKQVFGLLMLNRFLPIASNIDFGTVAGSGLNTSVSEFLFNQLSYWASQNKYNIGVNLNYNTYGLANTQTDNPKRRELIVGLQKSFFNDRLTIEAGGNFDVTGSTQTTQSSNRVAADVNVGYKLTKDGRYTLNAYNKSQYNDILNQSRNKRGVSISYKKEFDKFRELFTRNSPKDNVQTLNK